MNNAFWTHRRRFLQVAGTSAIASIFFDRQSRAMESENHPQNVYYVAPQGRDSNPGTLDRPWATIQKAADTLEAGQTVYIRGGTYAISEQIRPRNMGRPDRWITYRAYPGEIATIDAQNLYVEPPEGEPPFPHDQGAFQIEGTAYVRIQNLTLKNSHSAGFTVRNSNHIQFYNNTTINTYSSGIAVWTNCAHCKIMGNTIVNANTLEMRINWEGYPHQKNVGPHEAITLGGAIDFEVAYNHICYCQKEGIDCKETCARGIVHHNYTHHLRRQGLYVDSYFGLLEDIEVYDNVVSDCETGIAVSAEDGPLADNIRIHHNLVYNNRATGIFLSRWGKDRRRTNIQIYNNTVDRNGYGKGEPTYWLTGGLYLYTTNLENVEIFNNIFSQNKSFQIGYSGDYNGDLRSRKINIENNLIYQTETVTYPVRLEEWAKDDVYSTNGENAIEGDPLYKTPSLGNFLLQNNSPAIGMGMGANSDLGAFTATAEQDFWWLANFPPPIF